MSYRWEPISGDYDVADLAAGGLLPKFEDQARAEEWLGLFHTDLQGHGVADVSLFEEDRLVYGPMSLDD
ncbi:hypothetical protein FOJ82_06880 [Tessaracoccus rhinocerotis]|uniref:Uncharacterized protein n=1 Tax=Tessaracoccus rhinocerotis TaxID=1689449 RepID=A0A553K294_9ACTN|nr:hypothetical protein [Tessaracoccus rhinocerotis]TRY18830.1 hypothetical protein FOJ82_06880 [Tessaracoccus rhinocerotis]